MKVTKMERLEKTNFNVVSNNL